MIKRLAFRAILAGTIIAVLSLARNRGYAASPIFVTTAADTIAEDGECSLREAIMAANQDSALGGCAAGSGDDQIEFSPDLPTPFTITLTTAGANEDASETGDLDILKNLTIKGPGAANMIVDGNQTDRVFDIRPGAHVTFAGLTVQNGNPGNGADGGGIKIQGKLTLNDSTIRANQGGGLRNLGGALILNNVQVNDNTGGYGIYNESQATLTVSDSTISGNQGGGILNNTATSDLTGALIDNNGGSGIYNTGSTLSHVTVSQSTISNNSTTTSGGGIYNQGVGAEASILETTIRGNQATTAGGGIFNNGILGMSGSTLSENQARSGGGIDHFGGSLSLQNDTLSANQAMDNGGGLYNRGSAVLTNVTLNANRANGAGTGGNIFNDSASISLKNSIVANSEADGNCTNSGGFVNSLGNNLESGNTCGFNATGDLSDTAPELGPLQNNGGATQTHALLEGSLAINAGTNSGCPATDQRGVSRPQGPACDIGAYELVEGSQADLTISKSGNAGPVKTGDPITYTIEASNAGPDKSQDVVAVDVLPDGLSFVSATPDQGSCSETVNQVTCQLGELGMGESAQVAIVTVANRPGTVVNQASVSATTPDPDSTNNSTSAETTIHMHVYLPMVR